MVKSARGGIYKSVKNLVERMSLLTKTSQKNFLYSLLCIQTILTKDIKSILKYLFGMHNIIHLGKNDIRLEL